MDGSHLRRMSCVIFVISLFFVTASVTGFAQESLDLTVARLRSPDARERLQAIALLREAGQPAAIPAIAPLVTDLDDGVQLAAISAECALFRAEGLDSRAAIVDAFVGVPFSVFARPVPRDLTAALARALSDATRQVRLDAAYALGAIARPPLAAGDAAAVLSALEHPDPATRAAAARVAGRLQIAQAGDALVALMNDADADVRIAAMWAAGELRFERAVRSLAEFAAHYRRSPAGLAALAALAKIAHASSVPLFRSALTDRSADVRRLAAEGLGRMADRASAAELETIATSDRDIVVRAAALFALHRIGRPSVPSLAALLAPGRTFGAVRQYLLEAQPDPRALATQLASADAAVRRGVADVLGVIADPSSAAVLLPLQQDADPEVRAAATRALERLNLRGTPRTGTGPS